MLLSKRSAGRNSPALSSSTFADKRVQRVVPAPDNQGEVGIARVGHEKTAKIVVAVEIPT